MARTEVAVSLVIFAVLLWDLAYGKPGFTFEEDVVIEETFVERMSVSEVNSSSSATRNCYGNIMSLSPTGEAGTGIPGSKKDVQLDLKELEKRRGFYQRVADANCIQASVIAAVASRESRGGALLYKTNGYGDHGRAYGIMQCDIKHSGLNCLAYFWSSEAHILMMVKQLLVPYIKQVQRKFPGWTKSQALQGGVAAYNKGVGRVKSWANVDQGTTHGDYSNDVIARAQYLYAIGWN